MEEINRSWWVSNVMGALYGTALFYAVMAVLLATETDGLTGLPTAFETAGIYVFFFSVLWVSKRPMGGKSQ